MTQRRLDVGATNGRRAWLTIPWPQRAAAAITATLFAVTAAACDSGGTQPVAEQQSASATPSADPTLTKVELPDEPKELGELLVQRMRESETVRVSVTRTAYGNGAEDTSDDQSKKSRANKGDKKAKSDKAGKDGKSSDSGDDDAGEESGIAEKIDATLRLGPQGERAAKLSILSFEDGGQDNTSGVIVGDVVYAKTAGAEQMPGKPWLRLSEKDLANTDLGIFAKLFETILTEMQKTLDEMSASASSALLEHGTFTREPSWTTLEDGTRVRSYQGTTDLKAAAKESDNKSVDALAKESNEPVTWSLLVDEKGRPRKVTVKRTSAEQGPMTTEAVYSHWGDPVSIQPPPENRVATLDDYVR